MAYLAEVNSITGHLVPAPSVSRVSYIPIKMKLHLLPQA
jgi:hypothetical protein